MVCCKSAGFTDVKLLQVLSAANKIESEPGAALVLTLESTQISACSFGSLVSKGKFTGNHAFEIYT